MYRTLIRASILFSAGLVLNGQTPNPCDVNRDGLVNLADVQVVLGWTLAKPPPYADHLSPPPTVHCDLNDDGVCNALDLQIVIAAAAGGPCKGIFLYRPVEVPVVQAEALCTAGMIDPLYRPMVVHSMSTVLQTGQRVRDMYVIGLDSPLLHPVPCWISQGWDVAPVLPAVAPKPRTSLMQRILHLLWF